MHTVNGLPQRLRDGGATRQAADLGLLAATCFWCYVQWVLIAPTWSADPSGMVQGIFRAAFALVLGAACALVTPVLVAALFPNTAAGMLLHEQRRTTWFFPVLISATCFLVFYSFTIVRAWWQTTLPHDSWLADLQTVTTLIFFVIVPAWATNHASPTAWMAEVQQAHLVQKLRIMHQADIAAAKIAYFRALDKLRVGIANLSAAEQREVLGTLCGLQRAQNETLQAIADTFRTIAGAELAVPTIDDDQIVKRFDDLAGQLERRVLIIPEEIPEREESLATPAAPPLPPAGAATADRSGPQRATHDAIAVAQGVLKTGAWKRADLERALSVGKSKAGELIAAWRQDGVVQELSEPAYHYRFTRSAGGE